MKLALCLAAALSATLPTVAYAEFAISLRARVAAQCQLVDISATTGSSVVLVRTACNVPEFSLVLAADEGSSVEYAKGHNAMVSTAFGNTISVQVQNPGVQTFRILLDAPVGKARPDFAVEYY